MPTWVKAALFVLCLGGLALAFIVGRRKGLGRLSTTVATARAEGAAELRAQLGQHVNVSVDNSRRVLSPGGSSREDPALLSELAYLEVQRLRHLREAPATAQRLGALSAGGEFSADYYDRASADDYDDVGGGDDDDYHLALSRALDHDDGTTGYDSALYPSPSVGPRPGREAGQRGHWPDSDVSAGGGLRDGHTPRQIVVRRGRGTGR